MSFVKEIPEGLSYSVSEDKKATLDMRRTSIFVVPQKLEGVDRILVNQRQLQYVAPDFKGFIYICGGLSGRPTLASDEEMDAWHKAYTRAEEYSPLFFDISCPTAQQQEQMLLKGLSFERKSRKLNARDAMLLEKPTILGVKKVRMPNPGWVRARLRSKKYVNYQLKSAAKADDFRYIRATCHKVTRVSNTHPDRYL